MSFFNCVADAISEGSVAKDIGEAAQAKWREMSEAYERQGYGRHQAEVLAGEDVKEFFAKSAAEERHVYQSRIRSMREAQLRVSEAKPGELKGLMSDNITSVDYEARGIKRLFTSRLSELLEEIHPNLFGTLKNEKTMTNVTRELTGEATGSKGARAIADTIETVMEEARVMFNAEGGLIGKRDKFGLPHSHDRNLVTQAGQEKWVGNLIDEKLLDWTQIENFATGKPFQAVDGSAPELAVQKRFLSEIYQNIRHGKDAREASYGKAQGTALYKQGSDPRVLHFKDADSWIAYNRDYGTGDPFNSIIQHMDNMADDIALMRRLGPNPGLGLDYQKQLIAKRTRDEGLDPDITLARSDEAERMLRVMRGPMAPKGKAGAFSAAFFSKARHTMTAAFLDRAIIASLSDMNTMRLAAQQFGGSQTNVIKAYGQNMADMIKNGSMTTTQLKRDRWIMDSIADPISVMDRFSKEVPPGPAFERLVSVSMKVQGLTQHTDNARYAFQANTWGVYAENMGTAFGDLPADFKRILDDGGIKADIWEDFRAEGLSYEPEPGVTFMNPLYWRESTKMDARRADDVFIAMQGLSERWTEIAVPTNSLRARAYFDPIAFGMNPGSAQYEAIKSGGMFKSFVATYSINQYQMIMRQQGPKARAGYIAQLLGGATVLGAISLQLGEIIKGNDPLDMTPWENPEFWARAMLKGGGLGPIGDIMTIGTTSWGGGLPAYVAGPIFTEGNELLKFTVGNAFDAGGDILRGEEVDVGFARELTRLGKRYTPMGQTPMIGPAADRLIWDQLHRVLDPEADQAIRRAATARQNRDGNDSWWMPGAPMPDRMPDLGAALGQ